MPTAFAANTQSTVIGTEHFLASPDVAGTFTLELNLVNLANGDILEVRIYQKTLTGGTPEVGIFQVITDAQPNVARWWPSVAVGNELAETNALRFSIKQVRGSSRNIPWKVLKY